MDGLHCGQKRGGNLAPPMFRLLYRGGVFDPDMERNPLRSMMNDGE
jgi:hypothetical protein